VAVELVIPCWVCHWCKQGLYNLCIQDGLEGREFGCNIPTTRWPGLWGGYAEYMYVPYNAIVHKYPPDVNIMAAVFTEPLAIAVRAVNQARGRRLGDAAVIVGAGTIGLVQGIAAKAAGFDPVILLGTRDNRLELAMEVGAADVVVNIRKEDPLKVVNSLTDNLGAPVVFEAAGSVESQQTFFDYCRKGGSAIIVGMTGGKLVPIDIDFKVSFKELTVQPSFLNAGGYPGAMNIIKSGRFPIEKMANKVFPLTDAFEAMRIAREEHDTALKVVLVP
jgi:alcohol dehydrogenase